MENFNDKELLLLMIHELGRLEGSIRLQKSAFFIQHFLYKRKGIEKGFGFPFVRGNFGPFSQTLQDVVEKMGREGTVNISHSHIYGFPCTEYSLTDKGKEMVKVLKGRESCEFFNEALKEVKCFNEKYPEKIEAYKYLNKMSHFREKEIGELILEQTVLMIPDEKEEIEIEFY